MAKRRKRTNKHVPAKGRLSDFADKLWSLAIKEDWNHRCAVCRRLDGLNSHHIIYRSHTGTRWDVDNGICLCRYCHALDPKVSPHLNEPGWNAWLAKHHPRIAQWKADAWEQGLHKFHGTKNAAYYIEQIQSLKQYVEQSEFEGIVGVRFARWLDEQE